MSDFRARLHPPRWTILLLVFTMVTSLLPTSLVKATPVSSASGFAHYTVEARFDPGSRTVGGILGLIWTNDTGQLQSRLPLRLYANAPAYDQGGVVVTTTVVDSVEANVALGVEDTVLWVELPVPVPPGGTVDLSLMFALSIPTGTTMAVDVLRGSPGTGWWLADWLPILAGWEPGSGWYLEPPGTLGNPTFAETAVWSLALTLPADLAVFGTGHVTSTTRLSTGEQLVVIETPPVRDLSLVLLPAEGIDVVTREIRGRVVRLVIPPTGYPSALVDTVMDTAARVLPLYATWLGELPGAELDLVPVDLDGFGGIAWSDTIWLDLSRQAATDLDTASRTDLQFVVAHELAHQWVPIAIGSNNNRHNFMSESLASHLAVLALASSSDQPVAAWLEDHVVTPYRALLERGEDGIVDDPVASTVATSERAALIYGKGVLGFEAIRQSIGTDAYLSGLAQYADAFRFGISTPSDLRHAFESTSGQHLTDLWHEWFNAAVTTPADIDAILTTAPTIPLPATPNYPVTLSDDAVLSGARQFAPYAERELQAARRPRHPRHPPLSRLLPNPRHSERSSAAGRSLASRTNPSP